MEASKKKRPRARRRARTDTQMLRMDIIAPLFKRGYSYRQIRDEVMSRLGLQKYSLYTVKQDIDALLQEWREARIDDLDLTMQLELERIDELIKEAWAAYDKSKEDWEKKKQSMKGIPSVSEEEGADNNAENGIITVSVGQSKEDVRGLGDPRYLDLINKFLIERRKLLGLYAPEKTEHSGEVTLFSELLKGTGQIK